jgi:hypothetical protein
VLTECLFPSMLSVCHSVDTGTLHSVSQKVVLRSAVPSVAQAGNSTLIV